MEWNVFVEDINAGQIITYNIFSHRFFAASCKDALKYSGGDKEAFSRELRSQLTYYFWAKAEWEVYITSLFDSPRFKAKKVDVYSQVYLNWNAFVDYVWERRDELKELT